MLGMTLGLSCRQTQSQRLELRLEATCTLCHQLIDGEESRRPYELQIEALRGQESVYSPCLACGQKFDFADSPAYRRAVRAHVKTLRQWEKDKKKRQAELERTKYDWPPEIRTRAGFQFYGECPDCRQEMLANQQDYYECPHCRLQICISGNPVILREKGLKQFKLRWGEYINALDELPDGYCAQIAKDLRLE